MDGIVPVRPHPGYTRHGSDIAMHQPVTIAQAALGATIPVTGIDGGIVTVIIPPGTQPGHTIRISGHGVPARDQRGDLLVTVDVTIPTTLTDSQRQALEAFAAATEPQTVEQETSSCG